MNHCDRYSLSGIKLLNKKLQRTIYEHELVVDKIMNISCLLIWGNGAAIFIERPSTFCSSGPVTCGPYIHQDQFHSGSRRKLSIQKVPVALLPRTDGLQRNLTFSIDSPVNLTTKAMRRNNCTYFDLSRFMFGFSSYPFD